MKRFIKSSLAVLLTFIMIFGAAPLSGFSGHNGFTIQAEAAGTNMYGTYVVQGKTIPYGQYTCGSTSYGVDGCWNFANMIYKYIWNITTAYGFSSQRGTSDDMLRNVALGDARAITAENTKNFISQAALGATIRITSTTETLNGNDSQPQGSHVHSLILVQKDSNGFTVYHSRNNGIFVTYYTWQQFATDFNIYGYFKYIKWPGAPAYSGVTAPTWASISTNKSSYETGESVVLNMSSDYGTRYDVIIYQGETAINYLAGIPASYTLSGLPDGSYRVGTTAYNDSGYAHGSSFVYFTVGKYTVSYNSNGGFGAPSTQTKIYGTNLTLSSTKPTRSGYSFICWTTKADGSGRVYEPGEVYTGDANLTLYAQWLAIPSKPTGLKAVSASYNSIKLSWSAVSGDTSYIVYRYNSSTKAYDKIKTTTATTFTDTGRTTGKEYTYTVTACTKVGIIKCYSPSAAFKGKAVPAVPGSPKAASASYNSIKLSWSAVSGATGYIVYRYNSSTKAYDKIKTTAATTFTDTGRTTGKEYTYKVRAYKTVNGTNIFGNPSTAFKGKAVPAVPGSTKAASASYNSIKLSWSAVSGATGYIVYRYNSSTKAYDKIKTTTATTFTDTGRTTGKTYAYKVRAYRAVNGANVYGSPSAAFKGKAVPAVPGSFSVARASSTSIKISWSAVQGASGYEIQRSTSSSGTFTTIKTTTGSPYTNSGLTSGKTYYYRIRAYRTVDGTKIYGSCTSVKSAKT